VGHERLLRPHFEGQVRALELTEAATKPFVEGRLTLWSGITLLLFNFGAFFGINAFSGSRSTPGASPPSLSRSCWR
jgi:hypothetical protein